MHVLHLWLDTDVESKWEWRRWRRWTSNYDDVGSRGSEDVLVAGSGTGQERKREDQAEDGSWRSRISAWSDLWVACVNRHYFYNAHVIQAQLSKQHWWKWTYDSEITISNTLCLKISVIPNALLKASSFCDVHEVLDLSSCFPQYECTDMKKVRNSLFTEKLLYIALATTYI